MHCFEREAKSQQIPCCGKVQSLYPAGKTLGTKQLWQPNPRGASFLQQILPGEAGAEPWVEAVSGEPGETFGFKPFWKH